MAGLRKTQTLAVLAALTLSACGVFDREEQLPGQRFDTRLPLSESLPNADGEFPVVTDDVANIAQEISLAAPQSLAAWPQRGSNAQNLIPHAALSAAPTQLWAVDIGQGNGRRGIITADPVAADGRIFALDALGQLTAVSSAGAVLWRADLTAGFDRGGGLSGGGLALSGETIFATTGYGELVALDVASGAVRWRQRLNASLGTPTVSGALVYAVGSDGAAWAIEAGNGRIRWNLPATITGASLIGGAAPAISDRAVIFPFGSGELVSALRESGVRVWGTSVAGSRRGVAYNNLAEITGDPVVRGGTLYAGNQSGRVVALNASSGERIWSASEGAYSPILPAGGSLFFVSDRNELLRLDEATGERVWGTELPLFVNNRVTRRRAVFTHFGPILAGGRLIVASGDGMIRLFDPTDGAEVGQVGLRGGAASNPIVMSDTLYVVSEDGRLHAYR